MVKYGVCRARTRDSFWVASRAREPCTSRGSVDRKGELMTIARACASGCRKPASETGASYPLSGKAVTHNTHEPI